VSRFIRSFVMISSVFAGAAAAQAGDQWQQHHSGSQGHQQNRYGLGSWDGISRYVSDFKHHHDHKPEPTKNPIPIDPGRGDGRVPTTPVPQPPARDGFVWVKDHWERARAPKTVNPYPADVVVRDHRTPPTSGGVIVHDHRAPTGNTSGGTIIRDHRTTTDWTPAGTVIRDHRTTTNGNASGGTVIVTNPVPRNDGPVIRDHRETPVIRDHRTTPVIRDHRTGQ
jgi:hypothetical protein